MHKNFTWKSARQPWFCGFGVNEDTLKLYIYVEKIIDDIWKDMPDNISGFKIFMSVIGKVVVAPDCE